jgi:hypothetical protein
MTALGHERCCDWGLWSTNVRNAPFALAINHAPLSVVIVVPFLETASV